MMAACSGSIMARWWLLSAIGEDLNNHSQKRQVRLSAWKSTHRQEQKSLNSNHLQWGIKEDVSGAS